LNDLQGKLAQRLNLEKSELINNYDRYWQLFASERWKVNSEFLVDDDTVMVQYQHANEEDAENRNQSLAISSYVTCYARLKLFNILHDLHQKKPGCVLYTDTGSYHLHFPS